MCEMEEDERRQQHRRATTGVCERGEALCEDAEQQVRTMMLVVRESMRRRYISQRYCRSRLRKRKVRQQEASTKIKLFPLLDTTGVNRCVSYYNL